jgi:hypothetical protein
MPYVLGEEASVSAPKIYMRVIVVFHEGREGKGRERKGREGKGREGKGREGKGREGKGRRV